MLKSYPLVYVAFFVWYTGRKGVVFIVSIKIEIINMVIALIAATVSLFALQNSKKSSESAEKSASKSNEIANKNFEYTSRERQRYTNQSISVTLLVNNNAVELLELLRKNCIEGYTDKNINTCTDGKTSRYIFNLNLYFRRIKEIFTPIKKIDILAFSNVGDNRVQNCKKCILNYNEAIENLLYLLDIWINDIESSGSFDEREGSFLLNDETLLLSYKNRIDEQIEVFKSFDKMIKEKTGVTNAIVDEN